MIKKVLRDSLPTMMAVMMYSLYGVIDGLFIGNSAGDIGLAAINIVWPIAAVIIACGIGIGTGGSVLISNYRGIGDKENQKTVYGTTLSLLMIVSGILFVVLQTHGILLLLLGAKGDVYIEATKYIEIVIGGCIFQVMGSGVLPILRNIGKSVHAMGCMCLGVVLNISANYYLMMVAGMGIQGAAIGTIISQGVVSIIGLTLLFREKDYGFHFRLNIGMMKKIVQAGFTPFGIYLAPSITLIFMNLQCLRYGGDAVVACYAVISYIVFPSVAILSGVGDGTQPLISFYNGAGQDEALKEIRRISFWLLSILSVILTVLVVVLAPNIGIWFGLSGEANQYFVVGMRISAISFIGVAFTRFNCAYLNATMHAKKAVFLTYAESLMINPILLFILPVFWDVVGIWSATIMTTVCMLLLYNMKVPQKCMK